MLWSDTVKTRAVVPLAFTVGLALSGCGDTGVKIPDASTSSTDAMPSASCLEAANHSDLPWLEENVFGRSCSAFSACHKDAAQSAGGLNLEPGNVRRNLVNQPSLAFPTLTLVVPGDPDSSYLMVLLGSRDGMLPEAGTMPYNNPLLCKAKRDAIERWIVSLAAPDAGVPDAGPNDDGGVTDAGIGDAG